MRLRVEALQRLDLLSLSPRHRLRPHAGAEAFRERGRYSAEALTQETGESFSARDRRGRPASPAGILLFNVASPSGLTVAGQDGMLRLL